MDGDDQEYTEPSIIEYARFHGLARDHLSVNPLCSGHIPLLHTLEFLDSREPNGSFSQDHLPAFALNEQTSLDEDAQSLLAKATSGPTGTGNRVEDTADHRRIKKLKLELPITRTDHDLDMRDFALQYEPDLSRLNFPMVQVDEENDEGMTWPSYVYDFVNRSNYSQLFEKLSATKDDLLYLQAICRDDTQQSDTNSLEKGLLIHRTNRAYKRPSSPILPTTPCKSPFQLSSSRRGLKPLPAQASLVANEERRIDGAVAKRDCPLERYKPLDGVDLSDELPTSMSSLELYPFYTEVEQALLARVACIGVDERNIEGSLTPLESYESPTKVIDFGRSSSGLHSSLPLPARVADDSAFSDDEKDVALGTLKNSADMTLLLRKRKLQLERTRGLDASSTVHGGVTLDHSKSDARVIGKTEPESQKDIGLAPSSLDFDGPDPLLGSSFSAANALANFMELRGRKRPKLADDPKSKVAAPSALLTSQTDSVTAAKKVEGIPTARQHSGNPLPEPTFEPLQPARSFIISSTVVLQRSLLRRLEQLYPKANLIEREFLGTEAYTAGHGPLVSARNLARLRKEIFEEADIILSPSTGLLCTTLAKIKQRPLPGQVTRPALRERIERISGRYERLVILISEGRIGGDAASDNLGDNNCDALLDFMGFCAGMTGRITSMYVGGGEEELAQWIVGLMIRHGVTEEQVKVLQEETLWERFLRRAGMNAFAAQAVLTELKASEGRPSPEFGLPAFVKMSADQRVKRFEQLLGGRKVLLQVSANLDAQWQDSNS